MKRAYPVEYFSLHAMDVAVFKDGTMKIFEINVAPQYTIKSQFDYDLKANMLRSAFDLIGMHAKNIDFNETNSKGYE